MHFKETENVNQIALGEDISNGERVMKYSIETLIKRKWKLVCEGTSVGNKRIQKFPAIKTKSLRLAIHEAKDTPDLLFFNSYFVNP